MCIIETNFIRVSQQCISHYFCFISHLKQLYISNIAIQDTSAIGRSGMYLSNEIRTLRRAGLTQLNSY